MSYDGDRQRRAKPTGRVSRWIGKFLVGLAFAWLAVFGWEWRGWVGVTVVTVGWLILGAYVISPLLWRAATALGADPREALMRDADDAEKRAKAL